MSISRGFTLAELLIALAILGIIAVFTIPKVLNAQQNQQYNSSAKEVAATVSAALQQYRYSQGITANTTSHDLIPYINYVKQVTNIQVDARYTETTFDCSTMGGCYQLHNGGVLLDDVDRFGGTANTNAIDFWFDPDGKVTDGTTNGPGKSVHFWLYYNGIVRTDATRLNNTCYNSTCAASPNPGVEPPWFSWN